MLVGLISIAALIWFLRYSDYLGAPSPLWDVRDHGKWPAEFSVVSITSSLDGAEQKAYFLAAPTANQSAAEARKPLLVSLHTWSGHYGQYDPLAVLAQRQGWNYIHPDFRGANNHPLACLSDAAMSDIDDAIQYALDHGNVDRHNIFMVGVSGGGYATLGMYLNTRHPIKAFQAWVPISDLAAWYDQSKYRANNMQPNRYADDILGCTSSTHTLNIDEARKRSPLYMPITTTPDASTPIALARGHLSLYAGINDGVTGSVPISHSLVFYNRLVEYYGDSAQRITENESIRLLTQGMPAQRGVMLVERNVMFTRRTPYVSLTIFDGGHEMLPEYAFQQLINGWGSGEPRE